MPGSARFLSGAIMNNEVSIKVCMGTGGIAAGGVGVIASFEKAFAAAKIRATVDELRTAEHRLVRLKSMSRAHRDRAMREGL